MEKEQCNHKWETIERYKKYIGMSGTIFTEKYQHYSIVYVQQCRVCGKIYQSDVEK